MLQHNDQRYKGKKKAFHCQLKMERALLNQKKKMKENTYLLY